MANCLNCGRKLGCSCQRRTASDGKSVCTNCIINYEKILINLNKLTNSTKIQKKLISTANNPTIVNVKTTNIKYDTK